MCSWVQRTDSPGASSPVTDLCSDCLRCWCMVSCMRSWSYAGTQPPADPSLSFPPSCTAAVGSSSAVCWGFLPGTVCGLPCRFEAGEPSQFPMLAALYPTRDKFWLESLLGITPNIVYTKSVRTCLSRWIRPSSSLKEAPILLLTWGGFSSGIRG